MSDLSDDAISHVRLERINEAMDRFRGGLEVRQIVDLTAATKPQLVGDRS